MTTKTVAGTLIAKLTERKMSPSTGEDTTYVTEWHLRYAGLALYPYSVWRSVTVGGEERANDKMDEGTDALQTIRKMGYSDSSLKKAEKFGILKKDYERVEHEAAMIEEGRKAGEQKRQKEYEAREQQKQELAQEFKAVKFKTETTKVSGSKGDFPSQSGASLNGLTVTTEGEGKYKTYGVTHQKSGFSVLSGFHNQRDAKIALWRFTQLGDWGKTAEELKQGVMATPGIGSFRARLQMDALGAEWPSGYTPSQGGQTESRDLHTVETVGSTPASARPLSMKEAIELSSHGIGSSSKPQPEEHSDIGGYERALSPMASAKAVEQMNEKKMINGKPQTRKEYVENAVAEGATVGIREGQPAIISPDGRYMRQINITKTAIDYAEYLLKQKQPESPAPVTPRGANPESNEAEDHAQMLQQAREGRFSAYTTVHMTEAQKKLLAKMVRKGELVKQQNPIYSGAGNKYNYVLPFEQRVKESQEAKAVQAPPANPDDPRTPHAQAVDNALLAKHVTTSSDEWAKSRSSMDLRGVDTPKKKTQTMKERHAAFLKESYQGTPDNPELEEDGGLASPEPASRTTARRKHTKGGGKKKNQGVFVSPSGSISHKKTRHAKRYGGG